MPYAFGKRMSVFKSMEPTCPGMSGNRDPLPAHLNQAEPHPPHLPHHVYHARVLFPCLGSAHYKVRRPPRAEGRQHFRPLGRRRPAPGVPLTPVRRQLRPRCRRVQPFGRKCPDRGKRDASVAEQKTSDRGGRHVKSLPGGPKRGDSGRVQGEGGGLRKGSRLRVGTPSVRGIGRHWVACCWLMREGDAGMMA